MTTRRRGEAFVPMGNLPLTGKCFAPTGHGMKFDPKKHHRRSIRLKGYDYARAGAYFVTICTKGREHLFGRIEKGTVFPSEQGRIAERCWRHLSDHFWEVELDEFVLMPNHVHGIIIINHANEFNVGAKHLPDKGKATGVANASPLQTPHGTQSGSLGAIIQNFKSVSTRKINRMHHTPGVSQWQRNYYEPSLHKGQSPDVGL